MANIQNAFSGVHLSGNKQNQIVDSSGNTLLWRKGTDWNENDQIGFDLLMQQLDWENQINLMEYQNQYNSPVEQAKRMRAAGQNPDLQQLANNPSAAAAPSKPSTSLQDNSTQQFISSMVELVPQAIQMYQQIKSNNLDNTIKEDSLRKYASDFALERLITSTPIGGESDDGVHAVYTGDIKNKRLRKLVDEAIKFHSGFSPELIASGVYDLNTKKLDSAFRYLLSNERNNVAETDDLFVRTLRELYKFEQSAKAKKAKFDSDYYGAMNGTEIGKSEEQARKYNSVSLDKEFDSFIKSLWESNDLGKQSLAGILFLVSKLTGSVKVGKSSVGF